MRRLLPKKSKKGITLVEAMIAVVVLGIFATGILNLLTAGSSKILNISHESAAYSEANQKMDQAVSMISNGSSNLFILTTDPSTNVTTCVLNESYLEGQIGADVTAVVVLHDDDLGNTSQNIRGWYLSLTYNGATVKAFASHTEGVFDQ